MSNLIVEIITGHDRPTARKFGDREVFQMKGYMHTGGAFPVEFKLTFDSLPDCLEVGKYELLPCSFKAGKYGDLEIDRFNMQFKQLDHNQLKKVG